MRLYAFAPARRSRQILTDLLAAGAIVLAVLAGVVVHGTVSQLAAFGRDVAATGADFGESFDEIAETLSGVPLIGDGIRAPFDAVSDGASSLEQLGREHEQTVRRFAVAAGIATTGFPVLLVLLLWLPPRMRFARRASATATVAQLPGGDDLLALRALSAQPVATLARVAPDVADAWRRGDRGVVAALADLERESAGLPRARRA